MANRLRIILLAIVATHLVAAVSLDAAYPDDPSRWGPSRPVSRADYVDDQGPPQSYRYDAPPDAYRPARPPRQYLQSTAGSVATTRSIEGPGRAAMTRQAREQAYRQQTIRRTNWQSDPAGEIIQPSPSEGYGSNYGPSPTPAGGPSAGYAPGGGYMQNDAYVPGDGYMSGNQYLEGYTSFNGYGPDGYGDYGGDCCGDDCGSCGYVAPCRGPLYVRGEYLLWWLTGDSLPALVTTSPTSVPAVQAGVLGLSTTSIVYGDNVVNNTSRSGARVTIGRWLDPSTRIEGDWFTLGTVHSNFSESSNGDPVIARPFFNIKTGAPASNLLAYPGRSTGSINIQNSSNFLGAGIHATKNVLFGDYWGDRHYRLDFLYGFRYLGLYESLSANSSLTTTSTSGPFPVGSVFASTDSFSTSNSFFGANLGSVAEARAGRFCFTGIGRLGIGGTAERVAINGSSTAQQPGGQVVHSAGGFLALPSNIGNYNHSAFALVPHLELKIGYDLTPALRFTFGYDVLYWSRVVRPGQQIDGYINPTQSGGAALSGTPGPLFTFHETDLWVQGISTGLEYRF